MNGLFFKFVGAKKKLFSNKISLIHAPKKDVV